MELSSILTGIVVLSVLALLIWVNNFRQNQKKKKLLDNLNQQAALRNITISENDILNNNYIGIDKESNKVFFANVNKNIETSIDLQSISKCVMNENVRNVNTSNGTQKVIDKIELSFILRDTNKVATNLEFYNTENGDYQLSGEHQFLEKWTQIINKQIVRINSN